MIINENNKNIVLQGMVKRGFNQDPKEIKEKFYNPKPASTLNQTQITPQINKGNIRSGNLKDTFNTFKHLK